MQPTHNEQTQWQHNRNTPNRKAVDKFWSKVQNQSNSDIATSLSPHESLWPAARIPSVCRHSEM